MDRRLSDEYECGAEQLTPFTHTKRARLTGMDRARIFEAHAGHCAGCKRRLRPADRWEADHIIALENGGTNDLSNFAVLCEWCHGRKTGEDHGAAGRSRRVYTKHNVPTEHRRGRGWR